VCVRKKSRSSKRNGRARRVVRSSRPADRVGGRGEGARVDLPLPFAGRDAGALSFASRGDRSDARGFVIISVRPSDGFRRAR